MKKQQPVSLTLADFILLPLMVALWGLAFCVQGFQELRRPPASPPGPYARTIGRPKRRPTVFLYHDGHVD